MDEINPEDRLKFQSAAQTLFKGSYFFGLALAPVYIWVVEPFKSIIIGFWCVITIAGEVLRREATRRSGVGTAWAHAAMGMVVPTAVLCMVAMLLGYRTVDLSLVATIVIVIALVLTVVQYRDGRQNNPS